MDDSDPARGRLFLSVLWMDRRPDLVKYYRLGLALHTERQYIISTMRNETNKEDIMLKMTDSYSDGMCGWVEWEKLTADGYPIYSDEGRTKVRVNWSISGDVRSQSAANEVAKKQLLAENG